MDTDGKLIRKKFLASVKDDRRIQGLMKKLERGSSTYADADLLASRTGRLAGRAIKDAVLDEVIDGAIDEETASEILQLTMVENHRIVADYADAVQTNINRKAGNQLKAVRPKLNQDRIDGIVTELAESEDVLTVAPRLISQIENASMAIVDNAVQENFRFQSGIGRSPKILRTAEPKCCEWCENLAGEYEYADVRRTGNDVYRRHENCRCTVEFIAGDKVQDVHSKTIRYVNR